jgi:pyruvate formate lyase activating enzyme
MGMSLRINNIQRCSLQDGPGIRTTVFVQGCPLRCWWCHNPETREADSPDAREVDVAELADELERDAAYWAESGGGVTVSGGEPLLQADEVRALAEMLTSRGHHLAVDTCGAAPREDVRALAESVSLWLWDVKAVSPEIAEAGSGSDLGLALENLAWLLAETEAEVTVRVPLVAGFNALESELAKMAEWLAARARKVPVEVLPGHAHGVNTSRSPGKRLVPSEEEVEAALTVFGSAGLEVSCASRRGRR